MTRAFAAFACGLLLAVSAVGVAGQAEDPAPPWEQGLSLAEAEDINPDPGIVEINLTAKIAEVEVASIEAVKSPSTTAQVYVAGVGSVLPEKSAARTSNV